jgi:hypothetical protein
MGAGACRRLLSSPSAATMPPVFHFAPVEELDSHTFEEGCDHLWFTFEVDGPDPAPVLWSRVVRACSRMSQKSRFLLLNKETRPEHTALEEIVMESYHKKDATKLLLICKSVLNTTSLWCHSVAGLDEYRLDAPIYLSPLSSEQKMNGALLKHTLCFDH